MVEMGLPPRVWTSFEQEVCPGDVLRSYVPAVVGPQAETVCRFLSLSDGELKPNGGGRFIVPALSWICRLMCLQHLLIHRFCDVMRMYFSLLGHMSHQWEHL